MSVGECRTGVDGGVKGDNTYSHCEDVCVC